MQEPGSPRGATEEGTGFKALDTPCCGVHRDYIFACDDVLLALVPISSTESVRGSIQGARGAGEVLFRDKECMRPRVEGIQ